MLPPPPQRDLVLLLGGRAAERNAWVQRYRPPVPGQPVATIDCLPPPPDAFCFTDPWEVAAALALQALKASKHALLKADALPVHSKLQLLVQGLPDGTRRRVKLFGPDAGAAALLQSAGFQVVD